MSNEQKALVITGARKGIGRKLAEHYLSEGFRVYGCSRSSSDLRHEHYVHVLCDVSDEREVRAMFGRIRDDESNVFALISNAGAAAMNHALLTPVGVMESLVRTNYIGSFLCAREASRLMQRQGGGRIVNFSTVAVPLALAGEAAYAASKAAVESLTRVLARELAPHGITVNAIGPGPIATDLTAGVPREKISRLLKRQAIQRMGTYDDVANVVDFFLSPKSEFVTGQVMYLGGV